MTISPASVTVTKHQTATFYCSAVGNPKPSISWSKLNGSDLVNRNRQQDKLEIKNVAYIDSGKYVCTARNVLGQQQRTVELFVEGEIKIAFCFLSFNVWKNDFMCIKNELEPLKAILAFKIPASLLGTLSSGGKGKVNWESL